VLKGDVQEQIKRRKRQRAVKYIYICETNFAL